MLRDCINDCLLKGSFPDSLKLGNATPVQTSSLINNSSILPSLLLKRTENVISSIDFGSDDIAKIIHKLDPNKAHGHMISKYHA